jgi:hypothetical protein
MNADADASDEGRTQRSHTGSMAGRPGIGSRVMPGFGIIEI